MPRPVYIICSESRAVDRLTNLVSAFNILERIRVAQRAADGTIPVGHTPWLSLSVIATWEREDADIDKEFEHEITIRFPGKEPIVASAGKFCFKSLHQRFLVSGGGNVPSVEGEIVVTNRIREIGESDWHSQEYHIAVEMVHTPEDSLVAPD